MVGCVDLIRGYPTSDTAYIGLLLISEQVQRLGIGSATFELVEEYVRGWPVCERVRLAVARTNDGVIPFLRRRGFGPTGEIKSYRYGNVESESILFEKRLRQSAV